jgi:glutathione peroxidase-family protein
MRKRVRYAHLARRWNCEKFLIGRDGRVLKRYPPTVKPEDKGLLQDIPDAL